MSVPTIQRSDISAHGLLTEVGKGGEGIVFDVAGRPDLVYKEYLPRTGLVLNRAALEQLIGKLSDFTEHEQKKVLSRAAWPTTVVLEGARVVGYLMPRIPDVYWRTHGALHDPRHVPCDLNYLTHRAHWQASAAIASDVPRLDVPHILQLIADLAETMSILHRRELVMGDVSGKNLLWTDRPSLTVFVIDCDAFRVEGGDAINPPKESPDWGDPAVQHSRTNRASDVYKLALAAYRSLAAKASRFPPMHPEPIEGVPDALIDLIWRSLVNEGRPSSQEWGQTTRQIVQFGSRPLVALNDRTATATATAKPQPRRSQPGEPGEAGEAGPGTRPVIPVR